MYIKSYDKSKREMERDTGEIFYYQICIAIHLLAQASIYRDDVPVCQNNNKDCDKDAKHEREKVNEAKRRKAIV